MYKTPDSETSNKSYYPPRAQHLLTTVLNRNCCHRSELVVQNPKHQNARQRQNLLQLQQLPNPSQSTILASALPPTFPLHTGGSISASTPVVLPEPLLEVLRTLETAVEGLPNDGVQGITSSRSGPLPTPLSLRLGPRQRPPHPLHPLLPLLLPPPPLEVRLHRRILVVRRLPEEGLELRRSQHAPRPLCRIDRRGGVVAPGRRDCWRRQWCWCGCGRRGGADAC